MQILNSKDKFFNKSLNAILSRSGEAPAGVEDTVRDVIDKVRANGDKALIEYTETFDKVDVKGRIRVKEADINKAFDGLSKADIKLLELSAERIETFHSHQKKESWSYMEDGVRLGQRATPLDRVGIYVPGGKAAYPSTVLMNAVPAKVAGVGEIIMTTPPSPKTDMNPYVLASAKIAGVDKIYRLGGAQAIAAMAYGTKSVSKADKIVGPGNIYVATAKRMVFGTVDIDMIAGPSEILVISDGTGKASWIAADLLSQAEHDEIASSILITTSKKMARAVKKELDAQLKKLKRKAIATASIDNFGIIIVVKTLGEAARISNRIAPEHLELFVEEPDKLARKIRHAGAIFMGRYTPEALGDYLAGPNHTLPTGGTARFSSPLGVYDFIKFSSIIEFSEKSLKTLGPKARRFATIEGLEAHARSVDMRLKG
ncbi:Histidinol dehydrogenase [hydrothermal vent metagenome]|uniref:Histidinol dehydrogenase n=1 Tax=hydrothermal vent metagenome TaxID=652676 RepID=A0A3B0RIS1_9ZZZZ